MISVKDLIKEYNSRRGLCSHCECINVTTLKVVDATNVKMETCL